MNAVPQNGAGQPGTNAQPQKRRKRRQKPKSKRIIIPPVKVNGSVDRAGGGPSVLSSVNNAGVAIQFYTPTVNRNVNGFYFVRPPWQYVFSKISSQAGGVDLMQASVRLTSMQVEFKNLAPSAGSANIEVFKYLNGPLTTDQCDAALAGNIDSLRISTITPGKVEKFTISLAEKDFSSANAAGRIGDADPTELASLIGDNDARFAKFKFTNLDLGDIRGTVPTCGIAFRVNGGWAASVATLPAGNVAIAEVKFLNLQFKIVSD